MQFLKNFTIRRVVQCILVAALLIVALAGIYGGTVLRDAVRKHYAGHEKVVRIELGLNQGETDLILREL